MIEVLGKPEHCPICQGDLQYVETAIDFFVLNTKYYCPSCRQLVVAFPDQATLDRHRKLLHESRQAMERLKCY